MPQNTSTIISGGAEGIDTQAEKYASENNIPIIIFKPYYDKFRRNAPLKRNEEIVNASDIVIAIWDGQSKGTKYTIDYAKKKGKEIQVYIINAH